MTVDELAAEALEACYPAGGGETGDDDAFEAFIGSEDSGDPSWAARPSAQLRDEFGKRPCWNQSKTTWEPVSRSTTIPR
jgi:hypothetical protein